jgi:hypothetical protein
MSWIQQLEEEQYDRHSEYLAVMQAEAFDPYADERAYYCEEHDYEDYENACPFEHAPEPEPERTYIPEYAPPF